MPTLAHKIRLMPTPDQVQYFKRACSTARSVRNWGWVEWDRQRAAGQKPTAFSLKMPFNARARWPRSRNGEKAQRGVARAHLRGQHPPGVLAQDPHPSLSRNPRDRDGNVVGAGDAGESSVGPGRGGSGLWSFFGLLRDKASRHETRLVPADRWFPSRHLHSEPHYSRRS